MISIARRLRAMLVVFSLLAGMLVAPPAFAQQGPAHPGVRWARLAAEAYLERAEAARRRGDTAQAITAYMRALQADPTYAKAYFGLSEIRRAAGDLREAELLLNRAVGIADARAEALARRATVFSADGRHDLAIFDLEAAATADPSAERLRHLAGVYVSRRSWAAALAVYRRLRVGFDDPNATERAEVDETLAALAALTAESDAPQHDAGDRNWVRRSLHQIARRMDRRLPFFARPPGFRPR